MKRKKKNRKNNSKSNKNVDMEAGEKFFRIVAPEEKAAATCRRMAGKITFRQYLYLVERFGYDGNKIKGITKYRASQLITKEREKRRA